MPPVLKGTGIMRNAVDAECVKYRDSGHDYTISTLDVLQACDVCTDMGMAYSVIVQCADCVVFPDSAIKS